MPGAPPATVCQYFTPNSVMFTIVGNCNSIAVPPEPAGILSDKFFLKHEVNTSIVESETKTSPPKRKIKISFKDFSSLYSQPSQLRGYEVIENPKSRKSLTFLSFHLTGYRTVAAVG